MHSRKESSTQPWYQEMAKTVVPGLQERLRSIVNGKGWDYVVYWKLSDDQRFIDWVGCCCSGISLRSDFFTQSQFLDQGSCPDISFPHPPTKTCAFLSALTSSISMPIDSGVHGQVVLSGQPRWINFSADSVSAQDGVQTKVYIPIQNGVVELGSSNQVAENVMLIQSVKAKCGDPWQEFQESIDQQQAYKSFYKNHSGVEDVGKHFHQGDQVQWTSALEPHPWEHDMGVGLSENHFSLNIAPAQLNFLGQPNNKTSSQSQQEQQQFEGTDSSRSDKPMSSFVQSLQDITLPNTHATFSDSPHGSGMSKDNSETVKQETRADSSDCSDQVDDDDEKGTGRSGRRHLSKNLVAERKRRKKLNERLYSLRALVPKITKMDRASILGDAIEYVKELQQQVKELEEELESESQSTAINHHQHHQLHPQQHVQHQQLATTDNMVMDDGRSKADAPNELHINDKRMDELTQPMQVEVSKMDNQLLTLRIFCEKRAGVFVKLMQALDVLGLDILHANITTFRGLVLNVFNAEIRDKELMQAEQVKETLLEMTCQPDSRTAATATISTTTAAPDTVITIDA